MRKYIGIFISCCVVVGLIFLAFIALPRLDKILSVDNIKPLNILLGLFYAIVLSHPYIRTAQLILNRSMASQEQTFSYLQQKGMVLEYFISRAGYILIGIVVLWMALTSLFTRMSILHYLLILVYGLSIILLDLVAEKVKSDEHI